MRRLLPIAGSNSDPGGIIKAPGLDELKVGHSLDVAQYRATTFWTKSSGYPTALCAGDRKGFALTRHLQSSRWHKDDGRLAAAGTLLTVSTVAMVSGDECFTREGIAQVATQTTTSLQP